MQSDLRLRLLQETDNVDLLYYRNIFPKNKTATVQEFDFKFYNGSLIEKSDFVIYSSVAIRSIMARRMNLSSTGFFYVNLAAQTITDIAGNFYADAFINAEQPLTFLSVTYVPYFRFLINNILTKFTLLGSHEFILYPFELSNWRGAFSYFEQMINEVYQFNDNRFAGITSNAYTSLSINRPRFLFSPDDKVT